MAVEYKSIGALSQTTTTTLALAQPALAVGDVAVVTILCLTTSASVTGYTQVGTPFDQDGSYLITFWKYASSASGATTVNATVAANGAFGRIVVVTGAANSAPTIVGNAINSAAAYWQTPAINTTGYLLSTAMVWSARSATGTFTTSGTITHTSTSYAHDTVETFRYAVAGHDVTAASSGYIRAGLGGGTSTSRVRTVLIPALAGGGGGGGQTGEDAAASYYDGTTELSLEDTSLRYHRNGIEHGFWYPAGSQNFASGNTAAKVSYWDGTTEHPIPLRKVPTSTVIDGLSIVAYGDSYGDYSYLSGEPGSDFSSSSQIFNALVASRVGASAFTNRHRATFMAMDVGMRMNGGNGSTLQWDAGDAQAVMIHVGGNDLRQTNTNGYRAHKNAWNGILGTLRSSSRTRASGGTGTWTSLSVDGSYNARRTTVPGSSISLSWTGSNATLMLLAERTGAGSTFSYSVDGGTAQNLTTVNQAVSNSPLGSAESDFGLVPVHIKNLGTGSHTVVVTHTGSNGNPLIVDSILPWHSNPESTPWTIIIPIPATGLGNLSAGAGVAPTKQEILDFHQNMYDAMAEAAYLPKTIVVLPDSYGNWFFSSNEDRFITDGYHPNRRGQEIIADVVYWGIAKWPGVAPTGTPPAQDTTAPSAPTGLAASNETSSSIFLSWNASSDDVGVTGYRVFRNGTQIASPTTTTYLASGLSASTQYSFYVQARDAAGNWSTSSSTITPSTTAQETVPTSGVYGPDGTHWPSSTPQPNATFVYDVEVAATPAAITSAINAAPSSGNARIRVQPGQFTIGLGSSSADSFWLDAGPSSRSSKILIVPRDGYGTVSGNAGSTISTGDSTGYKIRLRNVSMVGFDFENQAVNFCDANNSALGWSTFGWLQVTARTNDSNNIELVECVLPNQVDTESDRSAVRIANDYGVYGLLYAGCYIAPAYKATGSSAHCDTLQFSVSSGSGQIDDVIFRDSIFFQSSSQVFMAQGLNGVSFDHSAFIGGLRGTGRYPIANGRHVMVAQNTLWGGAGSATSSNGSVVMGSMNSGFPWSGVTNSQCSTQTNMPAGWTANSAWDSSSTLQTSWINTNSPNPTPSYLAAAWAAL